MYRSTTPTIILNIKNEDFDMNQIDICHVAIESENGRERVIYENPEIDIENKQVRVTMTQEETLKFSVGIIKLQIKVKLKNDVVISSQIIKQRINEILEEEML